MPVSPRRGRLALTVQRVRTEPGLLRNAVVVLALIVIAGVVGGIILGNQRFVPPWSDRLVISAEFPATPGISPANGQEVRIAGVNVGDITDAEVTRQGKVRLTLSVEHGHRLYENASLLLRPKSPLNEMYVAISPGGPPAREVGANHVFPIESTERPIQVDEVLRHLDDNAQRMLTSLLAESDTALTSARIALPGGLDATRQVANDLRPVAEQLARRKELIRRLVTSVGQIAHAVGGDDQRLRTLVASLQTTLRTFGGRAPQVDQTLAELPGLVDQLRHSTNKVRNLSDQLDPTLRNLARASDAFPTAMRELRGTTDRLDTVVDTADPFLDAAKPVLADLRPFAAHLDEALPELRAATKPLDPVTDALLPYLPDVAAFTVQTRSLLSLQDANSGILRAAVPISSHFPPPTLGPNNGIKPITVPGAR
ncbi:phospholipid/cholesterol/gamma-HCH transport system substrate-binding protein [Pseudonocardia eucalypti]|nr:phospholipid/cholesterol/gamma-HCH transport system substrate-binding protein [Pseudonocardia eucalypti]